MSINIKSPRFEASWQHVLKNAFYTTRQTGRVLRWKGMRLILERKQRFPFAWRKGNCFRNKCTRRNASYARKQKRVTTATATKTPPNEKLNEWKNGFASAFGILVHFLAVFCKKVREMTNFYVYCRTRTAFANFSYLSLEFNAVITHLGWAGF